MTFDLSKLHRIHAEGPFRRHGRGSVGYRLSKRHSPNRTQAERTAALHPECDRGNPRAIRGTYYGYPGSDLSHVVILDGLLRVKAGSGGAPGTL